jgi:hypothetical protein
VKKAMIHHPETEAVVEVTEEQAVLWAERGWKRVDEKEVDETPADDQPGDEAELVDLGGGWWRLPSGRSVHGRDVALEALDSSRSTDR